MLAIVIALLFFFSTFERSKHKIEQINVVS